ACLHWLPQETILFDASRLERRLDVDVAADATLLIVEAVVLGRAAMGETLRTARFSDSWRIRRDGRLVFAEETRCDGVWEAAGAARSALGGASAFATLLLASPSASDRLAAARDTLQSHDVDGGASVVDGLLVVRLVAGAELALRKALIPLIECLSGAPPPRVWMT
ncbi:MAG: urease accessory protein UreD, partial [Beijerinckiaceae bacterium]